MRLHRAVAALVMGMAMAGCAGPGDREAALNELDPAPMSDAAWSHVTGIYLGAVRASSQRFGYEGLTSMDLRLELSGRADQPGVLMRVENGFSTAWEQYGERKGTYTNIPSKRYGSQGWIEATTHAPNQLLLHYRRYGGVLSPTGAWMILTFRPDGNVPVDYIGHSGYRGDGEFYRKPDLRNMR